MYDAEQSKNATIEWYTVCRQLKIGILLQISHKCKIWSIYYCSWANTNHVDGSGCTLWICLQWGKQHLLLFNSEIKSKMNCDTNKKWKMNKINFDLEKNTNQISSKKQKSTPGKEKEIKSVWKKRIKSNQIKIEWNQRKIT